MPERGRETGNFRKKGALAAILKKQEGIGQRGSLSKPGEEGPSVLSKKGQSKNGGRHSLTPKGEKRQRESPSARGGGPLILHPRGGKGGEGGLTKEKCSLLSGDGRYAGGDRSP